MRESQTESARRSSMRARVTARKGSRWRVEPSGAAQLLPIYLPLIDGRSLCHGRRTTVHDARRTVGGSALTSHILNSLSVSISICISYIAVGFSTDGP